jgi:putative DNA primase/helicase
MKLPAELFDYRQWVLWRIAEVDGRKTILPISPWSDKLASCDKPQTWSSYKHVRFALRRFCCDGIGFVFTDDDPFCGIDLDKCRTANGIIAPEAFHIIQQLNSYSEISPSGTGIHVLIKAELQGRGRRRGKLEVYDSGRYFTITGNHLAGLPRDVYDRQAELHELMAEWFPALDSGLPVQMLSELAQLSDTDLIERARKARNGERFTKLWCGDISDYGDDHSRADAALCSILAFWTGGSGERIDRLFRLSGLMRAKWDRKTGGTTYSVLTVQNVLDLKDD